MPSEEVAASKGECLDALEGLQDALAAYKALELALSTQQRHELGPIEVAAMLKLFNASFAQTLARADGAAREV